MKKRPGPKVDPKLRAQVEAFLKLQPGESFFVVGKKASDLEYLRRPVRVAGAGIQIVAVTADTVHEVSGVRVWRREGVIDSSEL